jgi:hypothetical protein
VLSVVVRQGEIVACTGEPAEPATAAACAAVLARPVPDVDDGRHTAVVINAG